MDYMQFAGGQAIGEVLKLANEIIPAGQRHADSLYSEWSGVVVIRLVWVYKNQTCAQVISEQDFDLDKIPEILQKLKERMRGLVDPYDTDPNLK